MTDNRTGATVTRPSFLFAWGNLVLRVLGGLSAAFVLVAGSAVLAQDEGVTVSLERNGARMKLEGLNEPVLNPEIAKSASSQQMLRCVNKHVVKRPAALKGRRVQGFSASVLLVCRVTGEILSECQAIATRRTVELGFTDAAMCLAGDFRVAPQSKSGEAVEGRLVAIDLQLRADAG